MIKEKISLFLSSLQFFLQNTTGSSYNDGSDSEDGLHDSLDDATVPDSGIGSSSERGPAVSTS